MCHEKQPKVVVERSEYCILCHSTANIKSGNMCTKCYESAEQKALRAAKKVTLIALNGNCVTIGCGRLPYKGNDKCKACYESSKRKSS
jgi:hypothetical protein